MKTKSFSPSFIFFILLLTLGILFANNYSAGVEKIATLSLQNCTKPQLIDCKNLLIKKYHTIEQISVDHKTHILSIRYNSTKISLDNLVADLKKMNITVQSSNSIRLMKNTKISKNNRVVTR